MHLPGLSELPCAARVRQLVSQCALVACELALDELPQMPTRWAPPGWSLRQALPPARYEKVRRMMRKSFGIDMALFDHLPPLALISLLPRQVLDIEGRALDEELWQMARAMGKSCVGLETAAEQAAELLEVPLDLQVRELMRIARNPSAFRRRLRKRRQLYLEGRIQMLYRLVRKESGRARKTIIDARNERMAARAWPLMQRQPVFIAVGAAHLPGHKGLLRLFKHRGARLQPLPWHNGG